MNYLKEIIAFYDYKDMNRLSAGQNALWYALMAINNKAGWKEWFTATNKCLENQTGLSQKGVYNAREALKEKGLIDFKKGGHNAAKYRIKSLLLFEETTTLNKQNETKQNETNYNKYNNEVDKCGIADDEMESYRKRAEEAVKKIMS